MKIKFIKMVVFRDSEGTITHSYHEGDTIEATVKPILTLFVLPEVFTLMKLLRFLNYKYRN